MRKLALFVLMLSMTSMVGCGFDFGSEPEVNELAKQLLPGTWSDSSGQFSLTFNEDGEITGFTCSTLPEELANIKFDGSVFSIDFPDLNLELEIQLLLQVAKVDTTGLVTITYRGELAGIVGALFDPGYIEINITGQLDNVNNPTRMTGTLSATAFPSRMLQTLGGLEPEISIGEDIYFDVLLSGQLPG
jgi:hypothetical protein